MYVCVCVCVCVYIYVCVCLGIYLYPLRPAIQPPYVFLPQAGYTFYIFPGGLLCWLFTTLCKLIVLHDTFMLVRALMWVTTHVLYVVHTFVYFNVPTVLYSYLHQPVVRLTTRNVSLFATQLCANTGAWSYVHMFQSLSSFVLSPFCVLEPGYIYYCQPKVL